MKWILCAAMVASVSCYPCLQPPLKGTVACDTSKTPQERAQYIVSQLQNDEKIGLMANGAAPVKRLNIYGYQWWSEGLHGVANSPGVSFAAPTPYATSFPQVITTSASFNTSLYHSISTVISTEGRAMYNSGHAGLTYWTPNINLMRDPRWGRGQETPGEDPVGTAKYAENFVPGMQIGEDPSHLKTAACCKHYYAYDMENWGGVDRHHFNAIITDRDEADTYLPAFHSCVANGKAAGMMCSYNAVNGTPSCANDRIMNGFARGKWGFDGYITSDCGAVWDVAGAHHYASPADTCKIVLEAGMDTDCGTFLATYLNASMANGTTPQADVDTALQHLFSVQVRFGFYDPLDEQPYLKYNYSTKVNTPEHQKLALETARQGMVLLKNDGTLPLSTSTVKTVAVIGPNANATKTMQGNYYGDAPYLISPLMGIAEFATTTYSLGCDTNCANTSGFPDAITAASNADATILVIGISTEQEAEAHDRTSIALPGYQEQLIADVAEASHGPVTVVVMAGGSIDFSVAKTNPKVNGIMWVGYPGQSGGQAIAETIFGVNNPSGRLPHTQYPKDYLNNLSMFDMNMRPGVNNTGRTYRFYTGTPVYAYGSGLSYSSFSYGTSVDSVAVSQADIEADCQRNNDNSVYSVTPAAEIFAQIIVTVTNTGDVAGAHSVLAFVESPAAGLDGAPIKSLINFDKVFLQPGEKAQVSFPLHSIDLSLADLNGQRHTQSGTWQIGIGPTAELTIPVKVQ
eukprot:TRINITY_DN1253_c2_g3_i1.p1 TRINITY_DN1253_c2_g3~~TRINITY_DN1253_c2_g3_i1.p1  ORF type:complete len:758 (+),score=132.26 TRINITY_DN1253_c2_g3_i1:47-2275(+)